MLRQQTLGIITSSSRSLVQADLEAQANVGIILALYKHESSQGCSVLTIIIPDSKAQVCASVVRTRYNDHLSKPEMVTVIESPSCAFDVKALGGLYKISRAAMERAVMMSKNQLGFDDWDDLDLPWLHREMEVNGAWRSSRHELGRIALAAFKHGSLINTERCPYGKVLDEVLRTMTL
jgi:hypothetical protein